MLCCDFIVGMCTSVTGRAEFQDDDDDDDCDDNG
jgi:hypothetical protein